MLKKILTTFIFLFLFTFFATSQQYFFRSYSLDEGLPQSEVWRLLTSKTGYIWLGTNGGGLSRFNGKTFKTFTEKDGLADNNIREFLEDSKGNLWIATFEGITKFDGKKFKTFSSEKHNFLKAHFNFFLEDKKNKDRIWISRIQDQNKGGIFYIENGKIVNFLEKYGKDLPQNNTVYRIGFNPITKNLLLFSIQGVFEFDGKKIFQTKLFKNEKCKDAVAIGIIASNSKGIWVTAVFKDNSKNTVYNIDSKGNFKPFILPKTLNPANTANILERKNNELWFICGLGVWQYKNKKFYHYNNQNSGIGNNTSRVVEDLEGNIWVGTFGKGLFKFSGKRFITFNQKSGLQNEIVRSIYQDWQGDYWFGALDGVISKWDGKEIKNYQLPGNFNGRIKKIQQVEKDVYWIGSDNGLFEFKNETFKNISQDFGLPPNATVVDFIRKSKKVWFAVRGNGLALYEDNKTIFFSNANDSLISNNVQSIFQDSKKRMWICTDYGLTVLDGKNIRNYTKKDGLGAAIVLQAIEDKQGNIWFATYGGGISKFNGKTFENISIHNSDLSSNIIYSILQDKKGYIWVGTQTGIEKIVLDQNGKLESIKSYGKHDGFVGEETNGGANFLDKDGNLWFGTIGGVIRYNPKEDRLNSNEPITKINNIRLFFENVNWLGEEYSKYHKGLKSLSNLPQDLVLPYYHNHITFDFEVINYSNPDKVQYQWKLTNVDKDWSPISSNIETTYANLPPGRYTFKVRASNGEGVWNKKAVIFSFEILPPWWQTWWAKGLGVFFVIGFSFIGVRWRMNALKQRQKELEKQVNEKTKEVRLKNAELEQQKEEILVQAENLREVNEEMISKNTELEQQQEEIRTQRDKIEESYHNIRLLSDIGQEVTTKLSVESIVDTVYENVNELMDATIFGIGIYNRQANSIDFKGLIEKGEKMPLFSYNLEDKNRLATHCFQKQEEILIENYSEEHTKYIQNRPKPKLGETVESIIYVPLNSKDIKIGVLTVQSLDANKYTNYQLNIIRNLAIYTSIALLNADAFGQIEEQKQEIERKSHHITASIEYGKIIQEAVLPEQETILKVLPESFIFFKPRDIVSGDFYWFSQNNHKIVLAAVDCTGHGVPGAFMSMIGNNLLNEIVNEKNIIDASEILNTLHIRVREDLRQQENDNRDGMDLALCVIDKQTNVLEFAGAKNPLVYIRNNEMNIIQGDKFSIGGEQRESQRIYQKHCVKIEKNDVFYIFSDGFQDQFGGENNKKFNRKRFYELLLENHQLSMNEQKEGLQTSFLNWISFLPEEEEIKQLDDILVMGFRL